jgi:hypothetical protein
MRNWKDQPIQKEVLGFIPEERQELQRAISMYARDYETAKLDLLISVADKMVYTDLAEELRSLDRFNLSKNDCEYDF